MEKEITLREHLSRASKARWDNMTPEEKSAVMSKASRARWAKRNTPTESSTLPHTGNTSTNDTK